MPNETNDDSITTAEKLHMTEKETEAYNMFIDYMAKLYREYSYLLEENEAESL